MDVISLDDVPAVVRVECTPDTITLYGHGTTQADTDTFVARLVADDKAGSETMTGSFR